MATCTSTLTLPGLTALFYQIRLFSIKSDLFQGFVAEILYHTQFRII